MRYFLVSILTLIFTLSAVARNCLTEASSVDEFIYLSLDSNKQQEKSIKMNAVYLEAWGAGGFFNYTLNYDRILLNSWDLLKLSIRAGANIPSNANIYTHTFPILLNLFYGNKANLDLGIGWVILYNRPYYDKAYGAITGVIGFRYQNPNGGVMFRLGVTPTFGVDRYGIRGSVVGASLGFNF